jgi:hypothetical protein
LHTEARRGARVAEEFRRRSILRDDHISPPIAVDIRSRGGTLLAVHFKAGLLTGHGLEGTIAAPTQQQGTAGVLAGCFDLHGKEVLAEYDVFIAIAVKVTHGGCKRRRVLGLDGEIVPVKLDVASTVAIKEHHRGKRSGFLLCSRLHPLCTKDLIERRLRKLIERPHPLAHVRQRNSDGR